ncbi:Clp protease N-terminal domain-containing protein [Kribbella sp. NPDC026611]|uniref:Clp protease N-terminal domain-containing protein n=1 Tax=Kribbella sp. NPDC026611 TaxID=3154911 RepID=UPI00340B2BDC
MSTELKDLRTLLVHEARDEARRDGSRTVEAEHVLLALAATDTPAARMLAEAGLTVDAIRAALDQEWEQSLAVAGIAVKIGLLPTATPDHGRTPKVGESAITILRRALDAPPKQSVGRIGPTRLLIGILDSDRSRVARALKTAGVDRLALRDRALEALAQGIH